MAVETLTYLRLCYLNDSTNGRGDKRAMWTSWEQKEERMRRGRKRAETWVGTMQCCIDALMGTELCTENERRHTEDNKNRLNGTCANGCERTGTQWQCKNLSERALLLYFLLKQWYGCLVVCPVKLKDNRLGIPSYLLYANVAEMDPYVAREEIVAPSHRCTTPKTRKSAGFCVLVAWYVRWTIRDVTVVYPRYCSEPLITCDNGIQQRCGIPRRSASL